MNDCWNWINEFVIFMKVINITSIRNCDDALRWHASGVEGRESREVCEFVL
jgi:hypothetical protein